MKAKTLSKRIDLENQLIALATEQNKEEKWKSVSAILKGAQNDITHAKGGVNSIKARGYLVYVSKRCIEMYRETEALSPELMIWLGDIYRLGKPYHDCDKKSKEFYKQAYRLGSTRGLLKLATVHYREKNMVLTAALLVDVEGGHKVLEKAKKSPKVQAIYANSRPPCCADEHFLALRIGSEESRAVAMDHPYYQLLYEEVPTTDF